MSDSEADTEQMPEQEPQQIPETETKTKAKTKAKPRAKPATKATAIKAVPKSAEVKISMPSPAVEVCMDDDNFKFNKLLNYTEITSDQVVPGTYIRYTRPSFDDKSIRTCAFAMVVSKSDSEIKCQAYRDQKRTWLLKLDNQYSKQFRFYISA